MKTAQSPAKTARRTRSGTRPTFEKSLAEITPAEVNDQLYRPVDPNDPEVRALADSVRRYGVKEPLVVTLDGWLLSGHRRLAAARLAGLATVPVRVEPIRRGDDEDHFLRLLREYNRQREKSFDEKLREELLSVDTHAARHALQEFRRQRSQVAVPTLDMGGRVPRKRISGAKDEFRAAILRVVNGLRAFWPVSDRQVHYGLLNFPPLKHASKPGSRYDNTLQSYKSLVELLTRMRLNGEIPMYAIGDETRPVITWDVFREPRPFIRRELEGFLRGYSRDPTQSQPNHVEAVGEKNTVASILKPPGTGHCLPLTAGRGYCSLPPRYEMAQRYRRSGKAKLVLLIVSDFDPDGEGIAESFARSMRDDFKIFNLHPIKVALTAEQAEEFALPTNMVAKESSSRWRAFTERHGEDVWELEALEPEQLQQILTGAIESVIDADAYNAEVEAEGRDAAQLEGLRRTVRKALAGVTGAAAPLSDDESSSGEGSE